MLSRQEQYDDFFYQFFRDPNDFYLTFISIYTVAENSYVIDAFQFFVKASANLAYLTCYHRSLLVVGNALTFLHTLLPSDLYIGYITHFLNVAYSVAGGNYTYNRVQMINANPIAEFSPEPFGFQSAADNCWANFYPLSNAYPLNYAGQVPGSNKDPVSSIRKHYVVRLIIDALPVGYYLPNGERINYNIINQYGTDYYTEYEHWNLLAHAQMALNNARICIRNGSFPIELYDIQFYAADYKDLLYSRNMYEFYNVVGNPSEFRYNELFSREKIIKHYWYKVKNEVNKRQYEAPTVFEELLDTQNLQGGEGPLPELPVDSAFEVPFGYMTFFRKLTIMIPYEYRLHTAATEFAYQLKYRDNQGRNHNLFEEMPRYVLIRKTESAGFQNNVPVYGWITGQIDDVLAPLEVFPLKNNVLYTDQFNYDEDIPFDKVAQLSYAYNHAGTGLITNLIYEQDKPELVGVRIIPYKQPLWWSAWRNLTNRQDRVPNPEYLEEYWTDREYRQWFDAYVQNRPNTFY